MRFCFVQTRAYLPTLLLWCALAVPCQVAIPVLEMLLPKAVIAQLTGGGTLSALVWVVLGMTLALALLSALDKLAIKMVFQCKMLMGTHYMRLITLKGLRTDYCNQETQAFRQLQQESYSQCSNNESDLRNVYLAWIGLAASVLGFAVYAALLVNLNALIVVFLAATSLGSYLLNLRINRWADEHRAERTQFNQRLGYVDRVAEDAKSAKDVRLYRMEAWLAKVYAHNLQGIAAWYRRYGRVVLKTSFFDASLSLLREGLAYAYLIYLACLGEIDAGDFVMYFAAITGFSGWLGGVMAQLTQLSRLSLSVAVVRRYLDYPEGYLRVGGAQPKSMTAPADIVLKDVCYRYQGAQRDTLHRVSLTLRAGEHIGIVGLNGAGKTTLMKLVCGLCDPTQGQVLYGGRDLREYDRDAYTRLFAAVFQQYSLLPLSIRELIAQGEAADDSRITECLTIAGVADKIATLPKGLDTPYDPSINEGGVSFSGGETQKLLLARAMYRNAPCLILDEPTAALDPISENRLYETYHAMTEGKTSLFISHRLASTRFCDRILLLEDGRIVQQGTHDELLKQQGRYRELFETQARCYREEPQKEASADEN